MSLFKGKYLAPQKGPGLHLLLLTRRQRWENRCDFEATLAGSPPLRVYTPKRR